MGMLPRLNTYGINHIKIKSKTGSAEKGATSAREKELYKGKLVSGRPMTLTARRIWINRI
jgi:hypothetical protein